MTDNSPPAQPASQTQGSSTQPGTDSASHAAADGTPTALDGAMLSDPATDEAALLAALRAGDERAFAALVDRYHETMVRVAQMYVADRPTAEEVVQEAWLGVLSGIDRFEGRSALKTWIFRIVTNRAKTRGKREKRTVSFSMLGPVDDEQGGEDPTMFRPEGQEWAGAWAAAPESWLGLEERLLQHEARKVAERAIAELPERQRMVITLRDVEGWTSDEVRNEMAVSKTNQRVLLHRARVKVRQALDDYLARRENGER